MKIVSGETMQQMDRRTIEEFHVPGLTLMERAGAGCAEILRNHYAGVPAPRAVVVAGKGNNGGDGYVLARLLRDAGWQVQVFVLASRREIAGDAAVNLERLDPAGTVFCTEPADFLHHREEVAQATVIVDAIFGTGLKSLVTGSFVPVFELINNAGSPVMAMDIPSGIDAGSGRILGSAIRADMTVTFAAAKIGHVVAPGLDYCGELTIVDIGIPAEVMAAAPGWELVDRQGARALLRPRRRTAHKGTHGHLLLVAGSRGKSGAAAMAASSAVRGGAGLVTAAVPEALVGLMEIKTTEAMTISAPDDGAGNWQGESEALLEGWCDGKQALAVGPGIGSTRDTMRLVQAALRLPIPMVLDADGLNALAGNPSILLKKRNSALIMTPHPGEMARLAGTTVSAVEADRVGFAQSFAVKYRVHLILKGARTVIAAPDGAVAVNGSGNPGMATGGMGDVLTGLLGALLAQGYDPFAACRLGVYVHGLAADLVAAAKGEIGLSAVDVQEHLPYAFKDLLSGEDKGLKLSSHYFKEHVCLPQPMS